jgi:Mg2+ and Co2+ transporter CorA
MKALTVVQSSIEVGLGCTLRYRSFSQLNSSLNSDSVISDLENYMQQMKTHEAKVESILQSAEWTSSLVSLKTPKSKTLKTMITQTNQLSKILEYRNDEAIRLSEEAIRSNGEALKQITSAIRTENEKFNQLTTQTAQDSKMMKALTFLATLYLPASLIAVRFLPPHELEIE